MVFSAEKESEKDDNNNRQRNIIFNTIDRWKEKKFSGSIIADMYQGHIQRVRLLHPAEEG